MDQPTNPQPQPGQTPPGYAPVPPQPAYAYAPPPPPPPPAAPKRGGMLGRLMTGLITSVLLLSIFLNFYMGALLVSMTASGESVYREGNPEQRIVIVPVKGAIGDDMAGYFRRVFKQLRKDPPKAVVLRVESPGGGITASDQMWFELTEFQKATKVPVVASYGSLAASGGYYISCPSEYIFAEPTTITGSIGVIAQAFTFGGLLEKVGVTPEIITSTDSTNKDMLDVTRPWGDSDRATLRKLLDNGYDRFVNVVHQGRSSHFQSIDEVKKVATGAVYTAQEALGHKLVDELGYLEDAIQKAADLANLPAGAKPHVTIYRRSEGLKITVSAQSPGPGSIDLSSIEPDHVRSWLVEMATPRLEYRWNPVAP